MAKCSICGEPLPPGGRICSVCGTSLNDIELPKASIVAAPARAEATFLLAVPDVPANGRFCPSCRKVYGPDYTDNFCDCGIELMRPPPPPPPGADSAASEKAPATFSARPAAGTPCLTLFGPDRQPRTYFALSKDATLIGRLDPLAGVFPDIDLDAWLDAGAARKVSRQHALILRQRMNQSFTLRPLAGNTGTQLETEMVLPLQDYPLPPGSRMILGGVVRLKFEIA